MTKKNKIGQIPADNSCLSADKIKDYLTGGLGSDEMEQVRKHIKECEFCADAVEGYKKVQLKDSLINTVEQLNKKIDERTAPKEYKLHSYTKRIIAYSSLAASILILTGLFLLIRNLKIRDNLVTDKLSIEEEKQVTHKSRELSDETAPGVSYDSFAEDSRGERTALKEKPAPAASKSEFTSYDKSERTDIMEPVATDKLVETETVMGTEIPAEAEAGREKVIITAAEIAMEEVALETDADMVAKIPAEAEADMEAEKAAYQEYKIADAPTAREAELSAPLMHDRGARRKKALLAKKGYSQPQEVLTMQMLSDEDFLYKDTLFVMVDELPVFGNNGLEAFKEYVQKNLQYPENARKSGIEGKVFVKFVVDTTGKVVNTEIINSVDSLLNKEALRVINSSPLWIPGKQDRQPVKVSYIIPVIFRID
ncbi:MAG: energy transducer TonB [Bacteroidales bacterium]|nr:MAG: energy transducer TonB [Bacteroidales bacterium]